MFRGLSQRHTVRALLTNLGFTISTLVAVAITAAFAFILDAPTQLVAAMLVLGLFTALIEYVLHSNANPLQ